MCYYDEWDEWRMQQAAKNARKNREQAEQLLSRLRQAAAPAGADAVKQPAQEGKTASEPEEAAV